MPVKSTDAPDAVTEVPDTMGYSVPVAAVTVPANVAAWAVDSVNAVVPAPVPVFSSRMPVLSAEIARPLVALPAVIVLDIVVP